MDPRLQQAIENDDVDELYRLIEEEGNIFDCAYEKPFANTPLHDAVDKGKTQVAMEMAILKPSFARKLNRGGQSPMHLALRKKHYHTARALMTLDPELIRVRGRGGITPLHYVAGEKGDNEDLELLAEFLCACKPSIEDLTSRCETVVHIAVKKRNLKTFKVLFGWLKRVHLTEILNWKDEDGNTALHIAVSEKQPEIIKLLIGYVKVNAKNFQDKTALDIFQKNPSGDQDLAQRLRRVGCVARLFTLNLSLSQFLSMELTIYEKLTFWFGPRDESACNIILVVAALIATATYQAVVTSPRGSWLDNSSNPLTSSSGNAVEVLHQAGDIIPNSSRPYQFTALNGTIFLASVTTIWITAIPLLPHSFMVYALMMILSVAYFATTTIELPIFDEATGHNMVIFCIDILIVVLAIPMYLYLYYNQFLCGIDATRRRIGNFLELKDRK
ncbi:ankyrin repeat-containing protein BDA1-like [Syzygium oleosum]|uniref:ankyrin repeat-containing protein BDA1-like n=1 Tax=Syzygium oleosum TaxID=219896 RepID=UPI0024B9F0BD|nr:ankyrin repeat-containing protein BDA1-like [Syzygium oleosum]